MRPLTLAISTRPQVAEWRRGGFDLAVAVNITIADLLDAGFPAAVAGRIAATGITPSALQLEITENLVMADPGRTDAVLSELRAMGSASRSTTSERATRRSPTSSSCRTTRSRSIAASS